MPSKLWCRPLGNCLAECFLSFFGLPLLAWLGDLQGLQGDVGLVICCVALYQCHILFCGVSLLLVLGQHGVDEGKLPVMVIPILCSPKCIRVVGASCQGGGFKIWFQYDDIHRVRFFQV